VATAGIEREVKLAAGAGMALPDLVDVLPGVNALSLPSQRLTATYYDTPDLRLARWGVTVRYRTAEVDGRPDAGAELPWTVKLPGDGARSGELARREVGFAGGAGRVPAAVADLVRGLARSEPLAPVARLRTDRLRLELAVAGEGAWAEVDDDEVSVLAGGRLVQHFREVEVELRPGGDPAVLDAVVARLRRAGASAPDPTPKVVRALGPRALAPPDVAVLTLGDAPTAAEAVTAAIASSVARLMRRDPGVRLGVDPEDVHQARVATRRLRSDLRTFRGVLDEVWTTAIRQDLRWLAALFGDVRDTDVLLGRLRSAADRLPDSDAKAADALLGSLADERDHARQRLSEGMGSPRYTQVLDALAGAAATPVFDPNGLADEPAGDVLPGLVRRPWRHLAKSIADLGPSPEDDTLHQVRIRAKRCRYAAEAVAPVVGKPAARLAEAVAEVQRVLGDFHDAIVAEAWLRQAAARGSTARAVAAGQLIAAEREEAARGRRGWKAPWKAASAKKLRAWMVDG
jgi:CHAD domain-containing protein